METVNVFEFLNQIQKIIENEKILKPDGKVVEYLDPQALKKQLNLSLDSKCVNLNELETICRTVIKYSIKTNSPKFRNALYGGMDLFGLGGAWLAEALNTNQHTYEVAPVFSLIEQEIVENLKVLIGYTTGDGLFAPGGSISNMYAMVLARFKKFPQIKTSGYNNLPTLTAYTSADAHYSLQKAAHWLGIGTDNLVTIKTDKFGRMSADDLEMSILASKQSGSVPFFVNATAGTTVLGAVDPLDEIANICRRHDVWYHVDACYGGALFLSQTHKTRLSGSERSDSIAWNPHKMLGAPLQCSVFITRHNSILHECNSASAVYLFQQDKFYDVSYDTGDKSVQCGRKVDSFKLWIMWKARGLDGFQNLIDNAMECACYFRMEIQHRVGFRPVQASFDTSTVCFWFIPEKMRGLDEDESWWWQIGQATVAIKEKMVKAGVLMISYSPLNGLPNFFRMVTTCHPILTHHDMNYVIEQIALFGNRL